MVDQIEIKATQIWRAECPTCGKRFITEDEADAIRQAKECFDKHVCMCHIKVGDDFVIMALRHGSLECIMHKADAHCVFLYRSFS